MKYVSPAITNVESAKTAFGSKTNSVSFQSMKIGTHPDGVSTFTPPAGYVANG